tara:strand:- start:129 stop:1103 length:975 start_codon:yes stop_codon:yes gene_type:complete
MLRGGFVSQHIDQASLLAWFAEHQRDLPWRTLSDPWPILLSEILLQQTQVSRGVVFWQRLFDRYPTIQSMAESTEEEVLYLWQGAGYYSRARRLFQLSKVVCSPVENGGFDGVLPTAAAQLQSLPGIGPYTAAAVASIAHGESIACVDGNVKRVMARQKSIKQPSEKEVQQWADDVLWQPDAGAWNQAVMELGATICTPKSPRCSICPVIESCTGTTTPDQYPAPKVRKKKRMDLMCILRIDANGMPELQQRDDSGILAGMWGPPLAETFDIEGMEYLGEIQHVLSHRDMHIKVWRSECEQGVDPSSVPLSSLDVKLLALADLH